VAALRFSPLPGLGHAGSPLWKPWDSARPAPAVPALAGSHSSVRPVLYASRAAADRYILRSPCLALTLVRRQPTTSQARRWRGRHDSGSCVCITGPERALAVDTTACRGDRRPGTLIDRAAKGRVPVVLVGKLNDPERAAQPTRPAGPSEAAPNGPSPQEIGTCWPLRPYACQTSCLGAAKACPD